MPNHANFFAKSRRFRNGDHLRSDILNPKAIQTFERTLDLLQFQIQVKKPAIFFNSSRILDAFDLVSGIA
jgi:hypothetical protein